MRALAVAAVVLSLLCAGGAFLLAGVMIGCAVGCGR